MWSNKKKKEQQTRPYRDAIARMIARALTWLQENIVHFLQRMERRLPLIWKKAVFLAFVTVCSAWCIYTFFRAVFPASKSPPVIAKGMDLKITK